MNGARRWEVGGVNGTGAARRIHGAFGLSHQAGARPLGPRPTLRAQWQVPLPLSNTLPFSATNSQS